MKLERIWLAVVFFVWLAGVAVWISSDGRGVPVASLWLWIAAVGLLSVPLVLTLVTLLIDKLLRRKRD
jgi:hypothetical protein